MILSTLLTIVGLAIFETISSIDNAVINAEVLKTMSARAKRWFLIWGILFAVVIVRGLLPWIIVWATLPELGPIGSLTATFSSDPMVITAIEHSAPILLLGAGVFLVLLFLHWLFLEPKRFGLPGEKFFLQNGLWFYATASLFLLAVVWQAIHLAQGGSLLAFGAVVGSTAFFIVHGFKQNAEVAEVNLRNGSKGQSDFSKILYLEIIDATFSIDGVLGAFAFTMAVPLIILGNGLGAYVVREMTMRNIESIAKYPFLKHGAMYSIFALGIIMTLHGFGFHIPEWVSPLVTVAIITGFILKSLQVMKDTKTV